MWVLLVQLRAVNITVVPTYLPTAVETRRRGPERSLTCNYISINNMEFQNQIASLHTKKSKHRSKSGLLPTRVEQCRLRMLYSTMYVTQVAAKKHQQSSMNVEHSSTQRSRIAMPLPRDETRDGRFLGVSVTGSLPRHAPHRVCAWRLNMTSLCRIATIRVRVRGHCL